MRLRDHRHSSDSRSKRRDHGKEQHPSPLSEEELDDLVRRILSRSLDKFDNGPPSSGTGRGRHERRSEADTSEEERNPARDSQSNELARLVLGYVAQFALKRYQERKKRKAANSSDYKKGSPARRSAKMPFLYGDGGRPLRSGERERMQRRRETGRSSPYDGASEIHLTDPLPPTPVPVVPPSTFLPPRDPAPEPKLRRRRRHSNLSGRQPAEAPRDPPTSTQRPPLVIPPSPEDKPSQPPPPPSLHRSHTWDSTPAAPPVPPAEPPPRTRSRSRYDDERPQERPGQSRSPYAYHPNYPIHDHDHDPYYNARPRRHHHHRTGPSDPLTPPVSPYRPPREDTLLRERERRIEKERDQDREQRQRDREYDKERRQRKEAERGRPGEGANARISVERSREAALALSIDDLLRQLRSTDDLVYRTVYRPTVEKYDERRERERAGAERGERCSSCRSIIMQSADLQRAIARARSSALAVRDLLDAALLEDRRKRRRPTVQFVSEQTM